MTEGRAISATTAMTLDDMQIGTMADGESRLMMIGGGAMLVVEVEERTIHDLVISYTTEC